MVLHEFGGNEVFLRFSVHGTLFFFLTFHPSSFSDAEWIGQSCIYFTLTHFMTPALDVNLPMCSRVTDVSWYLF